MSKRGKIMTSSDQEKLLEDFHDQLDDHISLTTHLKMKIIFL